MMTLAAFCIVLLIAFVILYTGLKISWVNQKKDPDLIEQSLNENTLAEQTSNAEIYRETGFINNDCTNLDDFIIDDSFNECDLQRLADFNGIGLLINSGWYPLTIHLVRELYDNGWNKKVSCIKEKYASLRFYVNTNDKILLNILKKYERRSEHVCETCSEKGEIRYNTSWQYVACRKHYLLNRGRITVKEYGFDYNGEPYKWNDLKNIFFEFETVNNCYAISVNFKNNLERSEQNDRKIYVTKSTIGYVAFLNHINNNYKTFPYETYMQNFDELNFCEICGYKGVYEDRCECCENESYGRYIKKWKDASGSREKYVKYRQLLWIADEGEIYEQIYKTYIRNPDYVHLFTDIDLMKFESENIWETDEN